MEKPDNDKGQTGQSSAPHRRFAETFRSQPPSDKETWSLRWHTTPHRITNKYTRLPRNSATPVVQVRGEKESLQSAAARGSIFQAAKTASASPPPPGSTVARYQSQKALLPERAALPGRGEPLKAPRLLRVGRGGSGSGLAAPAEPRRAHEEEEEEEAGDKDVTVLLSSYHRTLLLEATFTRRNPCLQWTEKKNGKATGQRYSAFGKCPLGTATEGAGDPRPLPYP